MAHGLDYAFSHPNLDCVKQSGYAFVARYIGDADPNPLKYLDAQELAQIRSRGLSVVVCRETTAGFMVNDSGAAHAKASRAHCNALGLVGIPVYYALDVDYRGLTSGQRANVTRFLQDAAATDGGGHLVGLYGSDDAIDHWVGQPYCHWGWQTYAWSSGRISPKAHFRQYRNGQGICGGTVDLNETYRDDYGQWPRPGTTPTPEPPKPKDVDEMYWMVIGDNDPEGKVWLTNLLHKWHVPNWDLYRIYLYAIRVEGGGVCQTQPNGDPLVWGQSHIDSIPESGAGSSGSSDVEVLNTVRSMHSGNYMPNGDTTWLVDKLKPLQEQMDRIEAKLNSEAPTPPAEPVAWPATGTIHGEITFHEDPPG